MKNFDNKYGLFFYPENDTINPSSESMFHDILPREENCLCFLQIGKDFLSSGFILTAIHSENGLQLLYYSDDKASIP